MAGKKFALAAAALVVALIALAVAAAAYHEAGKAEPAAKAGLLVRGTSMTSPLDLTATRNRLALQAPPAPPMRGTTVYGTMLT